MPYANKDDHKEWEKRYFKTDEGKKAHKAATKNYRKRNPEKYRATTAVNNAIRDEKIIRPDCCEECNSKCKTHGHHDDYSKYLDVRWLCNDCHNAWHEENGEALISNSVLINGDSMLIKM